MSGFRDDREALLARLAALEDELARAGGQQERAALGQRVQELTVAVRETTDRLDRDRGALAELGSRLDAIRRDLAAAGSEASKAAFPPAEASSATAAPTTPAAPPQKASLTVWIALAVFSVGLVLWLVSLGSARDEPPVPARAVPVTHDTLPGGVHAFDPAEGLEVARRMQTLGGGAQLSSIRARYVSSDGRVDLDARSYDGSVEYEFYEPGPPVPEDPQAPIGAPQPISMGHSQTVVARSSGMSAELVMPFPIGATLPDPRCTMADVWAIAIGRGAPRNAVATIDYGRVGDVPPSWTLAIEGTNTRLDVTDAECMSAREAARTTP